MSRRPLIAEWVRQWGLPSTVHRLEQNVTDLLLAPRTSEPVAVNDDAVLETDEDWIDLTDGGATTLHSHGGAATDHGALTGLADDDHPQYATDTDLTAHTGDVTDAHDASAISIVDAAGDFTATEVEGALAELQSDNEAHVAAADPHTGYVREADATWIDLTDAGATTLHSHAGGGGAHDLDDVAIHTTAQDYTSILNLLSLFVGDANNKFDLNGGNPRWTLESGVTLEYDRASDRLVLSGTGIAKIFFALNGDGISMFALATDAEAAIAFNTAGPTGGIVQFGAGGATALDMMLRRASSTMLAVANSAGTGARDLSARNISLTPTTAAVAMTNASAQLELLSTTKGTLVNKVTTTQRDAISSPATGLLVFNTTTGQFEYYTGAVWAALATGAAPAYDYGRTIALQAGLAMV